MSGTTPEIRLALCRTIRHFWAGMSEEQRQTYRQRNRENRRAEVDFERRREMVRRGARL